MAAPLEPEILLARFCAGFRPRRERLVGLEYELVGVDAETGTAVPYDGAERSVVHVLRTFADRYGWRAVGEEPLLELARAGSRITLEPGAQIELSGRPHARLRDAEKELAGFVWQLIEVSEPLGILWLPMGQQPLTTPEQMTVIPKPRYGVMTRYLPQRGRLAIWMMRVTAGVQVNLDVESAEEAAALLRLSLWASPILTALFANSPLTAGRPNGWLSHRARIWQEVDPDRCGFPAASLAREATIEDYARWVMEAPMFFIERGGELEDLSGVPFRAFMEEGARGHAPRVEDWDLHLTTMFPEVRLKTYLELRSADSNRLELAMGYAALGAGLVYGGETIHRRLEDLLGGWSYDERIRLLEDCARRGLEASAPRGEPVADLAAELVALADAGLEAYDPSARGYLDPVHEIVRRRRPPACDVLELWRGDWRSSAEAFATMARRNPTR